MCQWQVMSCCVYVRARLSVRMRASTILLGGGRHFLAPKSVWSPAGGWAGSSVRREIKWEPSHCVRTLLLPFSTNLMFSFPFPLQSAGVPQGQATLIGAGLGLAALTVIYSISVDRMVRLNALLRSACYCPTCVQSAAPRTPVRCATHPACKALI